MNVILQRFLHVKHADLVLGLNCPFVVKLSISQPLG